jgi:hypothetical protein
MKLNSITLQAVGPLAAAALIAATVLTSPAHADIVAGSAVDVCEATPGLICEKTTIKVDHADVVCEANPYAVCDARRQHITYR